MTAPPCHRPSAEAGLVDHDPRRRARAGVGAALLPYSLVSADLQAGRLVAWGDAKGPPIEIWALYPSRRLLSARVSAFLEYLKAAFPMGLAEELAAIGAA